MRLKHLCLRWRCTLRQLTVMVFVGGATVTLGLSWFEGQWLRHSALESGRLTLTEMVGMATAQALSDTERYMDEVAHDVLDGSGLRRLLPLTLKGELSHEALVSLLDDQFHQGLVSKGVLALGKLRLYDRRYHSLLESREGFALPPGLPDPLAAKAEGRDRVERLKRLFVLWRGPQGEPLASLLVPVGLQPWGYLEVVVNPLPNLQRVESITGQPLRLESPEGTVWYQSQDWGDEADNGDGLQVPFVLRDEAGEPLVRVVMRADVSALNQYMDDDVSTIMLASLLLVVIGAGLGYWFVTTRVVQPLSELVEHMNAVARGDMAHSPPSLPDTIVEVARLNRAVFSAVDSLRDRLRQIRVTGGQLSDAATTLSHHAQNAVDQVRAQTEAIQETHQAAERFKAVSEGIRQGSREAAELSAEVSGRAEQGREVVEESVVGMRHLAAEVEDAVQSMAKLSQEVERVGSILATIHEITEQTNLLALNAAIEAARAGESGRGFAVVADEVRSLARRTQQATGEIGEMLERLKVSAAEVGEAMARGQRSAAAGMKRAARAGEALAEITEAVGQIRERNASFADAVQEQVMITAEIHAKLSEIHTLARQVSDSALIFTSSGGDLAQMAVQLSYLVSTFRVDEDDASTLTEPVAATSIAEQQSGQESGKVELF